MKIFFVCVGNPFTEEMLYKENYFIREAVNEGHQVLVAASTQKYIDGKCTDISPGEKCIGGYRLIRMPRKRIINDFITGKIRKTDDLYPAIVAFKPDLIFYACAQIYNIQDAKNIKERLPAVKIVLDFSTKYLNSARNWLSLNILHKLIYRRWLQKALPYVDRIFYISAESREFIKEVYGLPDEKLEYNNLPGKLIPPGQKLEFREQFISGHGLSEDNIIFVHSGKMGKLKRTVELLECFKRVQNPRFRLFIAGSFESDIEDEAKELIRDDGRTAYLGFVDGDELTRILCAADLYLQPGTISQTSQTAICCGCPILFIRCPTNEELFIGNGFLLNSADEMDGIFEQLSDDPSVLKQMSELSYKVASEGLDCRSLFQKVLKSCAL